MHGIPTCLCQRNYAPSSPILTDISCPFSPISNPAEALPVSVEMASRNKPGLTEPRDSGESRWLQPFVDQPHEAFRRFLPSLSHQGASPHRLGRAGGTTLRRQAQLACTALLGSSSANRACHCEF